MVTSPSVNAGYQAFTAQPSVATGGPEAPARPDSVQHRSAPAADSQRGDQKELASRDEPPRRAGDGAARDSSPGSGRGSVVDLSV